MKHELKKTVMLIMVLVVFVGCHKNNEVTYWGCAECKKVIKKEAVPNGRWVRVHCNCTDNHTFLCSPTTKAKYDKYVKSRIAYEDDEVVFFLPNSGNVAEDYKKEK